MGTSSVSEGGAANGRMLGITEGNWVRATATGTGIQVIGVALKRNVDMKFISLAAVEVLSQYALLRTRIVEVAKGKFAYQFSDAAIAPSISTFPWPVVTLDTNDLGLPKGIVVLPGDDTEGYMLSLALQNTVQKEMNVPFRNASQKMSEPVDVFRIHVYSKPSRSRSLIILKFNSGAVDRPSVVNVAHTFFGALNAVVDGQVYQSPLAGSNNVLPPPLEDRIPKDKASKSLIQKGIDMVNYAMSANKFSLFPFRSGYTESKHPNFRTEILNYTLGKEATRALLSRSVSERTTYAAALSAAFLKGVAEVKELKDKKLDKFSFTSLLDCRPYLEPIIAEQTIGNYTTGISQGEQIKAGADFWDLARTISASFEKEKRKLRQFSELPVLNLLFSQVLKRPGLTQKTSLRTALFSLFADGPANVQWKNVDKLEIAGTLGPFASMHGIAPCFCLAEALTDGPELNLAVLFASPVYSNEQMEALADRSLKEVHAALKQEDLSTKLSGLTVT